MPQLWTFPDDSPRRLLFMTVFWLVSPTAAVPAGAVTDGAGNSSRVFVGHGTFGYATVS